MEKQQIIDAIRRGDTALGIEFGSTRIKAVLIGPDHAPIASGSHNWENRLLDGVIWSYSLEDIRLGLQDCYARLRQDVLDQYGVPLTTVGAAGVSAMMHGYMPFDRDGTLLVPFRTWRNTITGQASAILTEKFGFHIPQRWSVAHLYQAILNGEEHVPQIAFLTTLEGYVHWLLTGKKVLGVGEASGMFPLDDRGRYDETMLSAFGELIADKHYPWTLPEILPEILLAGEDAGTLTESGARFLDPSGTLQAGVPFCPPEGDAETGMTATGAVEPRTGNVSAGTSAFTMSVLEKNLSGVYEEIDIVATPTGKPVAMVHSSNCTSDLNAWAELFDEYAKLLGVEQTPDELYGTLLRQALVGDDDCGGLMAYNYYSGEHIFGFTQGRPLLLRTPESRLTVGNLMKTFLFTALGALHQGMELLRTKENVSLARICGHGGLFKTPGVAQRIMAAALNTPVTVMSTAGEGGAWGMALLAAYRKNRQPGESLTAYLESRVFAHAQSVTVEPLPEDVAEFGEFMKRYLACLPVEQAAVDCL